MPKGPTRTEVAAMVADYNAGRTVAAIALRHYWSATAVCRALRRTGAMRRSPPATVVVGGVLAVEMREMTARELCERTGLSDATVRTVLAGKVARGEATVRTVDRVTRWGLPI